MNQDTLNKIKSYKNSKYVWCAVVAREIQRWRDVTEFLEDIMQVLGDKEQN